MFLDISVKQRNKLMRVIHDARDAHPGLLLEPSDLGQVDRLEESLDKLEALGLLDLYYANDGLHHLTLTKKGLVYFELRSDERWRFIRRSVLIPIGVSFVTTLFVLAIENNWFVIALEWLLKHLAA